MKRFVKNAIYYAIKEYLAYDDLMKAIPSVDVVELQHGQVMVHEGQEDEYFEYCSECGTKDIHSEDNYCPNCGCKIIGIKYSNRKE